MNPKVWDSKEQHVIALLVRIDIPMPLNITESKMCSGSPKGTPYPGVHRAQHCQRARGGLILLCSLLCGLTSCTGEASPPTLSVGGTTSEAHKAMRQSPKEGYEDGDGSGGQDV